MSASAVSQLTELVESDWLKGLMTQTIAGCSAIQSQRKAKLTYYLFQTKLSNRKRIIC